MDNTGSFRQGIATSFEYSDLPAAVKPIEAFALAGEGLVLSIATPVDASAIAEHCQDPDIQRWTTVPVPYGLADAEYFVEKIVPEIWSAGGGVWSIRANIAGETSLIGDISLRKYDESAAEVGYWLAPHARGKGLMTKALRLVLQAAFERFGFKCVIWHAEVGNWDSWKCAWRLGFHRGTAVRGLLPGRTSRVDGWVATLQATDPLTPAAPWDGPGASGSEALDARDPEALVRQFHEVYELPVSSGDAIVDYPRVHMRMGLILEECAELVGAVYGNSAAQVFAAACQEAIAADDLQRDVVQSADALADLVYVIYGMALESGINLPAVLAEVQASNLSKLGADGKPIYREDGKVLKGPKYHEPNIARALRQRLSIGK